MNLQLMQPTLPHILPQSHCLTALRRALVSSASAAIATSVSVIFQAMLFLLGSWQSLVFLVVGEAAEIEFLALLVVPQLLSRFFCLSFERASKFFSNGTRYFL